MNYDTFNKIFDYHRKDIFPHLRHVFSATSFDDYLRRFSFLPHGKWLRDMEKVKVSRVTLPLDPVKLVKKFKDKCVTYNSPSKPDEGYQRAIYQVSPTLHFEMTMWIWIEHEEIQSYAFLIVCYNDEQEYNKFVDTIWDLKREGNTEDKRTPYGFNALLNPGFGG